MLQRNRLVLAAVLVTILPAAANAQFGVGAKIGTLGLGGEAAIGLGNHLALRAGIGFVPTDFDATYSGIDYTLDPPSTIWSVGIDLYPGAGGFHLSAGLVHRPHYDLTADFSGTRTVGNQQYTGTVHIDGIVENETETAPFVALGFGRMTRTGVGLFVDVGAAFMGSANLELSGTCTLSSGGACPGFDSALQEEEAQAEEDVGSYLKVHPILQIGLRFGFSR